MKCKVRDPLIVEAADLAWTYPHAVDGLDVTYAGVHGQLGLEGSDERDLGDDVQAHVEDTKSVSCQDYASPIYSHRQLIYRFAHGLTVVQFLPVHCLVEGGAGRSRCFCPWSPGYM